MAQCPVCRREIDDASRAAGACAGCGAALRPLAHRTIADVRQPPAEEADERPAADQTVELPAEGLGESFDIQVLGSAELSQSSPTIPELPLPPEAAKPPKPATVTFGAGQTIEFTGTASNIDESMLTSQWAGGVSAGSRDLGATIKQKETVTGTYVSSSSLIVKSRHVHPTGRTATPVASPADAPDYELLNVIGEGGMGVVYAARQSSIARTVALKMLKSGDADVAQRDKFISEAVVTGELDHPNIVPIYDLGANDDGALFYSMKRVKGTPWHKVLKSKSLDENLNILLRVADAVAFAHVNGVVHRDLKPENVMLGDFGEVLVMDWGLARVNAQFPNVASVAQSDAMGGTPAYMAPEMATGPLERITPASDVYLLGAILYEVITGKPPHTGKTVMACLFSAAKNQIAPTDKSGELVDIARKAMATSPEQRYRSVQEFQAAVREYQAHAESLRLLRHAGDNLDEGARTQNYELYARAIFALEESLLLWPDNQRARSLLDSARIDYARVALAKGDFDLGASLLDANNEDHRPVLAELAHGRAERESRQRRIKLLKGAVAALVASVVGVVSLAYLAVSRERDEAVFQRDRAVKAEGEAKDNYAKAEVARGKEAEARQLAEAETVRAVAAEKLAEDRLVAEEAARREADRQREIAEKEEAEADRQRTIAVDARNAEEYSAYVARIGLTNVKLDENAFDRAGELLVECPVNLRNWEWGRLRYLTDLSTRTWRTAAPIDALALSPDGVHMASGGHDGQAVIWNLDAGAQEHQLPQGQYVHAVAYDATGERLAAGSSDRTVNVYRAADGKRIAQLLGHGDAVLSVRFSPDGRRLLTSGVDKTARLWDLATGRQLQEFVGHSWWVWAAEFSPDGRRIVTAGQDGKAIVWEQGAGADAPYGRLTEFTEHEGPIYAARFSPTTGEVATAGADGRVFLWNPDEVEPVDVQGLIDRVPRQPPPFRALSGHRAPVHALAFAPDGSVLASGAEDNVLIVWDVAAAAPLKTLRGHAREVRSCVYAADGKTLYSAGYDDAIRQWRPAEYGETRLLAASADEDQPVMSARFSADGARVVTASYDRTASLWDPRTLVRSRQFQEGHEFLATNATFFADGARLLTAAGDGTVRLWDAATGVQTRRFDHSGRTGAAAVSDDGALVAAASAEGGAAVVWDVATGDKLADLSGHNAEVTAVRFAPGGKLLATGDDNGHIRLWRRDDAGAWTPGPRLDGHSRTITALAFVDGGRRLVSASGDNTCGQWDVAAARELTDRVLKHPDWIADMVATPDGQLALTCADDGKVRLWSLADAQILRTFETPGDASAFTSIDLSPDGRLAAAACAAEGTVRLWDLTTGAEITTPAADGAGPQPWLSVAGRGTLWAARFAPDNDHLLTIGGNDARLIDLQSRQTLVRFSPHGVVASADVSPDGARVVTGSWDRTAKVWDAATGQVVAKLPALHAGYINSVCFSPDGTRILTASDDGTARLWTADGAPLEIVLAADDGGKRPPLRQASFSPDGSQILTVGDDHAARLWDAESGALLATLQGHKWPVRCGGFSADGRLIITGSEDATAIVWDAMTRQPVATLAGHTGAVTAAGLSPDGSRALTGSDDNAVKLWDAATGKEILTLVGHGDEVTSASFSPDGMTALTSGRDGRVLLWPAADWRAAPQPPLAPAP